MEATRFHTLLADKTDVDFWARIQRYFLWEYVREKFPFNFQKQNLDDVRLSTAATNSARFPVISPPGAVRNAKHNVVDRIVDGGYIENYGAITAMELAVAINAVRPELAPFVLIISNDPDENPIINKIDVPDAAFLTDVSIPIQAIASARDGRGRLAVQQLNSVLGVLTKSECGDELGPHSRMAAICRSGCRREEERVTAGLAKLVALDTDSDSFAPADRGREEPEREQRRTRKDLARPRGHVGLHAKSRDGPLITGQHSYSHSAARPP